MILGLDYSDEGKNEIRLNVMDGRGWKWSQDGLDGCILTKV